MDSSAKPLVPRKPLFGFAGGTSTFYKPVKQLQPHDEMDPEHRVLDGTPFQHSMEVTDGTTDPTEIDHDSIRVLGNVPIRSQFNSTRDQSTPVLQGHTELDHKNHSGTHEHGLALTDEQGQTKFSITLENANNKTWPPDREYEGKISVRTSPCDVQVEDDDFVGANLRAPCGTSSGLPSGHRAWRPTWFRRRVLLAFSLWFGASAAAIEVLIWLSRRFSGIASPGENLYYLWTFGPTAVFTVTAALWGRVEYQAKRFTPWIQMNKGPTPFRKSVSLDYDSMIIPVVLLSSIWNRHYLVTSSVLTTLTLIVLVVLGSSLFVRQGIPLSVNDVAFQVQDVLVPEASFPTSEPRGDVNQMFNDILSLDMALPTGYYRSPGLGVAYQSFSSESAFPNTSIESVVDGIWSDLECEPATIMSVENITWDDRAPGANITMSSSLCQDPISLDFRIAGEHPASEGPTWSGFYVLEAYLASRSGKTLDTMEWWNSGTEVPNCTGSLRPVFVYGQVYLDVDSEAGTSFLDRTYHSTIINTTAVFCRASYLFGKVRVSSPGPSPQVEILPHLGAEPLEDDVHWEIWSTLGHEASDNYTNLAGDPARNVDGDLALGFQVLGNSMPPRSSLDADSMIRSFKAFYQQYPPLWAHLMLRTQKKSTIYGRTVLMKERLLVKPLPGHIMSGVLAFISVLLVIVALRLVPASSFVSRDPEPISGIVTLLRDSETSLHSISRVSETSEQNSAVRMDDHSSWADTSPRRSSELEDIDLTTYSKEEASENNQEPGSRPWYQPLVLRMVFRTIMSIILAGLIISLVLLLRHSSHKQGLGPAEDSARMHYLWTSLPTLVMTGVGLYFSSADHQTRIMAPYLLLRRKGLPFKHLTASVADQLAVTAMLSALRWGYIPSVLSTIASILVAFLTVFAATLFTESTVPKSSPILMQQEEWFASYGPITELLQDPYTGVLMNDPSTISYPPWSYETLFFPALSVADFPSAVTENMTITARTTAMRPALECSRVSLSSLKWQFWQDDFSQFLQVNVSSNVDTRIWDTAKCGDILLDAAFGKWPARSDYAELATDSGNTIGIGNSSGYLFKRTNTQNDAAEECSSTQFLWGFLNNSTSTFDYLVAYICQDSVEELEVDLHLLWPSLQLDPRRPPTPIEQTVRPATRIWPLKDMMAWSDWIIQDPESYFVNVASGRYHIESDWVGDPAHEEAVLRAQKDWWTLRISLLLSQQLRLRYNETPEILSEDVQQLLSRPLNGPFNATKPAPFPATITDWTSKRIVQNPTPTYVLIALLSVILMLNVTSSWVGQPRRRLLPRDPGSIASMASLLVDSNVFKHLPSEGAERLSNKQLASHLEGLFFRLGIFQSEKGEPVYTIGLVDAKGREAKEPFPFADTEFGTPIREANDV